MANITMTREQYEALSNLAIGENTAVATPMRDAIDRANGIRRFYLNIRWEDVGGVPPPRIELGKGWPPAQTYLLVLERRISRADVDQVLTQNTKNPTNVQVTPDRYGVVGWSLIADYDFSTGG